MAAPAIDPKAKAAQRKKEFLDVWPKLESELVQLMKQHSMPEDATEWFRRNLNYNTPHGKLNRGISVVDTFEILQGRALTADEFFKASVLGWCVELLQAYFLVADDMMDQSITRRGQACWYRLPQVGNIAINDSFMLEAAIYHLLKLYFREEKSYVYILELFLETTLKTEIGQLIDLITAPEEHVDLSKFSLKKHQLIVIYKTAYYSFYLPVALGMRYAGINSDAAYATALSILIPIGEYFQVQDDYLDCFGTPEQIGKVGTDILDNKCSWNVNIALQRASPEQRKILDENYGRKDSACEARVKAVFNELKIEELYREYEQNTYEKLNKLIDAIPESEGPVEYTSGGNATYEPMMEPYPRTIPSLGNDKDTMGLKREVFRSFLNKIYKRQK
ncbi:Farnesyl pyrophosphate synthase Short=FPP synthase; Short=FPS; AltName: Full=(2E,6E)-farnesyl diphosphate synthase; AltName: Full=Dimethylallyltranstransferase; AltName: Full=Farnesyl diphosphate synthase; AltName: Full=Geranyltranstransferase [Serendipita indica DSM 11827]|nr:Farnesyl pyrophosphate synthase Short=FPP synthase; Short=FPS; AltName: Full=(2E,6E)-farnesyl diphosphate synthase; AltName: Full=Dimethylallyltranstransferase; AltName: Full=Farnesyl diphosphate synthase; AltName: Full=Geranyltranstransferase [Serendipita indica DSM 11827]